MTQLPPISAVLILSLGLLGHSYCWAHVATRQARRPTATPSAAPITSPPPPPPTYRPVCCRVRGNSDEYACSMSWSSHDDRSIGYVEYFCGLTCAPTTSCLAEIGERSACRMKLTIGGFVRPMSLANFVPRLACPGGAPYELELVFEQIHTVNDPSSPAVGGLRRQPLKSLTLRETGLESKMISKLLKEFNGASFVFILKNKLLTVLESSILDGFANLTALNLAHNRLKRIETGALQLSRTAEYLYLENPFAQMELAEGAIQVVDAKCRRANLAINIVASHLDYSNFKWNTLQFVDRDSCLIPQHTVVLNLRQNHFEGLVQRQTFGHLFEEAKRRELAMHLMFDPIWCCEPDNEWIFNNLSAGLEVFAGCLDLADQSVDKIPNVASLDARCGNRSGRGALVLLVAGASLGLLLVALAAALCCVCLCKGRRRADGPDSSVSPSGQRQSNRSSSRRRSQPPEPEPVHDSEFAFVAPREADADADALVDIKTPRSPLSRATSASHKRRAARVSPEHANRRSSARRRRSKSA